MSSVADVIMNYVALASIGELDEIYYGTINSPLKDELEERDFEIPIKNSGNCKGCRDGNEKLHMVDACLLKFVSVIQFFYDTVYFYMFPMILYLFIYIEYGVGDSTVKNIPI